MQRYHMAQNQFGNYFMCGPNGADGNNESKFVLESEAQALIAAKDAEIRQQAEDLERLRETIDRLTKSRREVATRAESLESKCAKMRELLGECRDDGLESFELRNRIDAILEREEA